MTSDRNLGGTHIRGLLIVSLCIGVLLHFLFVPVAAYAASEFTQCLNDTDNDGTIELCQWGNGAINPNNSRYAESDGVPQRLFFTHVGPGSHSVTFQYNFTKNSVYAYDFIASPDHTIPDSLLNFCGNLPAFVTLSDCEKTLADAIQAPVPSDTFDDVAAHEHPPRNVLFGCIDTTTGLNACTNVNVQMPVHMPATPCFLNCGTTDAQITITFDTPAAGTHLISMWFAAQLASGNDPDGPGPSIGWGPGFGSSSAPGASFHVTLVSVDGAPIGSQDNQLQNNVLTQGHPADLAVTKADSPDPVAPGGTLTYTLNVTNNGPDTATGVFLEDPLPGLESFVSAVSSQGTCTLFGSQVSCDIGLMQPNDVVTVVITVTVSAGATDGTVLTNTATVSGNIFDSNPGNNTATATTTVQAVPPPPPVVDVAITKSGVPASVDVGDQIAYTLSVTNNGPNNATNVTVTDTLPGDVTFVSASASQGFCSGTATITCVLGNLASGAQATISIVVVPTAAAAGTTLTNTATVTETETDSNPGNNTATATTPVNAIPPPGAADVSITKSGSPDPVNPGGQITFTLVVTNNGPDTDTHVTVTDPLPSGLTLVSALVTSGGGTCILSGDTVTCELGDMPNGDTRTITITVDVSASKRGTIVNTATVTGGVADPNPSNNTATATVTITSPSPATAVPAMNDWGMIIFLLFAGLASMYRIGRKRRG